jgi:hypothetical protein
VNYAIGHLVALPPPQNEDGDQQEKKIPRLTYRKTVKYKNDVRKKKNLRIRGEMET